MADHPDFLRSVLANPDDDLPRLVYADWLEETGEESNLARAEFIRAQCEMEKIDPYSPDWYDLNERTTELYLEHASEWLSNISAFPTPWDEKRLRREREHSKKLEYGTRFRRGFPDCVEMKPEAFLERGDELTKRAPIRRGVFNITRKNGPALLGSKAFSRLTSVELTLFEDHDIHVILHSLGSSRLRELELTTCGIMRHFVDTGDWIDQSILQDADAVAIARCSAFSSLQQLNLSNQQICSTGAIALLESPYLASLTELDLGGNENLGDGYVDQLVGSGRLDCLSRLNLASTGVEERGLARLAESTARSLVDLTLGDGNFTGGAGLRHLENWESLCNLRELTLSFSHGCHVGMRSLIRSQKLANLRRLDLVDGGGEDEVAYELASSTGLARLKHLNYGRNRVSRAGAAKLLGSELAQSLVSLNLSNIHDHAGADQKLFNEPLPNLRRLVLSASSIAGNDVERIATTPILPELRELNLTSCPIGDEGAKTLLDSPFFGHLKHLDIVNSGVSPETVAKLRERYGSGVHDGR